MALQFFDNFQQYGTNTANLLNGPYAEINGTTNVALAADPDPTAGGTTVLRIQSADDRIDALSLGSYLRKVTPTPTATIGVMCRIWLTALPDTIGLRPAIAFTDASNANQVTVVVSPIGTLKVFRGSGAGTLLGESTNCIVANAWQHIEIKLVVSDTVGSIEIRVDTNSVLNLTGLDTKNTALTTIANVILANGDTNGTHSSSAWRTYFKDFVIWDTTGVYNNTFLGSCFVYSLRPDSDVSGTWSITGGAGSGWASINETNPDDDTKYISSPWPAATADVFTLTDLPADATSVKGLMGFVRSKKSDGGDGNLTVSLVSGASTVSGIDRPLTVAYTYWSDIFETDPATTVQWTVAATNAAKLKLDRTL